MSSETIRQWCKKFAPNFPSSLRKWADRLGETWLLDEVYVVIIQGSRHSMWRTADQDSNVNDILVQRRKAKVLTIPK